MFYLEIYQIIYVVFILIAIALAIGLARLVFMLPGYLNYKKDNEQEQIKLLRAIAQKLNISENDTTGTGI